MDTVSLFIRGPATMDRAFQWDHENGMVIWRRGAAQLDHTFSKDFSIRDIELELHVKYLRSIGLI